MQRNVWIVGLSLFIAFAGCAESPSKTLSATTAGSPASSTVASQVGDVEGRVLDDELRPILGARVELHPLGLSTTPDEEGAFRLEDVPAGDWLVRATAPLHHPAEANVSVGAEWTAWADIQLSPVSSDEPYRTTVQFEGHYTCAHEVPIWTGDCMILYASTAGENDTLTTEQFAFRTLVEGGWESVLLELVWTYAANNQLDGMRLYLENGNGTDTGHSYKVGRADGTENPLRVLVHRGETQPRADYYEGTEVQAFIPDEGQEVQIRVFPRGMLYEQASQICSDSEKQQGCFLGVGAGIDVRFTVFATVFYGERAPEDFTATQN